MNMPLVSVLMTAYNREKYIAEAIESVLASSYQNFELIIVDDCSTDNTIEIAKQYAQRDPRIKVHINEQNLGDYKNRNKAASLATGKYLKYLDSDDLIYKHGLAVMVESMERFPDAGVGISSPRIQDTRPYPIVLSPLEIYTKHFFDYYLLDMGPSGLIFNTQLFRAVGCFSGKNYVGDSELLLKMTAAYPCVLVNPSLTFWRIHEEQEIVKERKDFTIPVLRYDILHEALSSTTCPLPPETGKKLIRYHKQHIFRSLVKHVVISGNGSYIKELNNFIKKYKCGGMEMFSYLIRKPRLPAK
jgi:glycosyltransferase involved in cell wall biosynthesis